MKKLNNKGFSLVELIIVIAIMVVLIGLLAPQFIKWVEKSRQATDIQNLDSIVTVLQTYQADRTAAAIEVTGAKGGNFTAKIGGTDASTVLSEYGVKDVAVKGDWTTALKVEITADGEVSYDGASKYYKAKSDKSGYEAADGSGDGE